MQKTGVERHLSHNFIESKGLGSLTTIPIAIFKYHITVLLH